MLSLAPLLFLHVAFAAATPPPGSQIAGDAKEQAAQAVELPSPVPSASVPLRRFFTKVYTRYPSTAVPCDNDTPCENDFEASPNQMRSFAGVGGAGLRASAGVRAGAGATGGAQGARTASGADTAARAVVSAAAAGAATAKKAFDDAKEKLEAAKMELGECKAHTAMLIASKRWHSGLRRFVGNSTERAEAGAKCKVLENAEAPAAAALVKAESATQDADAALRDATKKAEEAAGDKVEHIPSGSSAAEASGAAAGDAAGKAGHTAGIGEGGDDAGANPVVLMRCVQQRTRRCMSLDAKA